MKLRDVRDYAHRDLLTFVAVEGKVKASSAAVSFFLIREERATLRLPPLVQGHQSLRVAAIEPTALLGRHLRQGRSLIGQMGSSCGKSVWLHHAKPEAPKAFT
jgi:hypothetical protein